MTEKRLKSVDLNHVKINDSFWSPYTSLVKNEILSYQWDAINDKIEGAEPSHCLRNFRVAAGEEEAEFGGAVFQDTDVAKWLEALAYVLAYDRDPKWEQLADEVIDLIGRAQGEDGYLNTYFTIKAPEQRWRNLTEGHELYTAGHFIEAAVAYYQSTGKTKFLNMVCKFADLICNTFGPGEEQLHGYPGHQEIELALVKLYYVTDERRYLETAKYFIDQRGQGENYFLKEMENPDFKHIFPEFAGYLPLYSQSHLPVRKQETAEGHAVRAVYMYCAMADLAYEYKDSRLLDACKKLWNNMVEKRMYVTGSIGSSGLLERFTTDYDLPNDSNYSETCASIGLALFGLRMSRITREASYIDIVERALYNTVLAGIAMDGKSFFYVNPLEVWPDSCLPRTSKEHVKSVRQKWFGVACCPPNIARTLASLSQYIYSCSKKEILINLFISNEAEIETENGTVAVKIETTFPVKNRISLIFDNLNPDLKVGIRIPDYAENFQIYLDGREISYVNRKGFAMISPTENSAAYEITFNAGATFIYANPNVRADAGRVCIMRGPLVYTFEEVDNYKNLQSAFIDTSSPLKECYDPELFGGTMTVQCKGMRIKENNWDSQPLYSTNRPEMEDTILKAVPYAYWNNRGEGEMAVWMKELKND